jgi:hypothetical protein
MARKSTQHRHFENAILTPFYLCLFRHLQYQQRLDEKKKRYNEKRPALALDEGKAKINQEIEVEMSADKKALEAGMLSDLDITFHGLSQVKNKDIYFTTGHPLRTIGLAVIRQLTGLPVG